MQFCTPHIPHSANINISENCELLTLSKCHSAYPRKSGFIIFYKWHLTQPTLFLFPFSCLCTAACRQKWALIHILIVSASKRSPALIICSLVWCRNEWWIEISGILAKICSHLLSLPNVPTANTDYVALYFSQIERKRKKMSAVT